MPEIVEHKWQRHPRVRMLVCASCSRHWYPDEQPKPTDPCTRQHGPGPTITEQAVILDRPQDMPCSELEPYDFGSIIPGACLVDVDPSEWHPLDEVAS